MDYLYSFETYIEVLLFVIEGSEVFSRKVTASISSIGTF